MENFEKLKDELFSQYAQIACLPLRTEALVHTTAVLCAIELLDTQTDINSRRYAALLHDVGRYLYNAPDHAKRSAQFAESLGMDSDIVSAIARHPRKKEADELPLAEDLKDADVLARWLVDPTYTHERLEAAKLRCPCFRP